MISNEGFKYFQSQKYLSSFLCLPKCVQIIKKCVKNWFRVLMADNCGMHLKIKSSVVCLKEQTVLQTLHTKNYFIQWWKNGKRSFANHINTRTVQQDFSKIHVQIICYEERFMVTHMPLFLYFNFLTNVFSFFYFIKIIKILLLLSFQLWSIYYTNKRQGPFELYNPFSHLLSQRLKTLSLENLNMAHLFSSQNRS